MLVALLLSFAAVAVGTDGEVSARFRCEPAAVEVGEPFELTLELEHPLELAGGTLAAGKLALDPSWVVLEELVSSTEPAAGGGARTRRVWRVASLEPGERALADALAAFAFPPEVARIQLGDARVSVRGVLAEGEDTPRPLREFPDDFADEDASLAGSRAPLALALAAAAVVALAAFVLWRRRRGRTRAPARATPLERLGELEGWIESERAREGCFELTRLLRSATDDLRRKDRAGLTDEEWLAELGSSLDVPRGAVAELEQVFERAGRMKYAGEPATPWALKETFSRARTALQSVGGGGGGGGAR